MKSSTPQQQFDNHTVMHSQLGRRVFTGLFLRLCLASMLGLLPDGVRAAETPPSQSAKPLRVGVSPTFPPMIFKQGKILAGAEVEMARALGEFLQRRIEFVELPWDDQIKKLNDGRTDIIMSAMSVTTPRQYVINFAQPYMVVAQMALVRRDEKHLYDLGFPKSPGTFGAIKGTTGDFLIQRDFPKASCKTFDSGEEAARALEKKKIDVFISDSPLIWYLAGTHEAKGLSAVVRPLNEGALAWGLRKDNDALMTLVNQFVEKSRKDGTFKRILQRWTFVDQ
jgi:polar amino acid transport system substrate-binding protein